MFRGALITITFLASLVLAPACSSREFKSESLGLKYEPPSTMKLEREEPGAAFFTRGLTVRSVRTAPPTLNEATVRGALDEIRRTSGVALDGKLASAKVGSIPAGEVARYQLRERGERTLVYVVPASDESRYVLVTLTAPDADYGRLESQVERSLSTLTLH